jgi:para-nitrobenzyl esterase
MRPLRAYKLAFMLAICLATISRAAVSPGAEETLRTDAGMISGQRVGDDGKVRVYKGIPFAAPPVGKLRWQPPQPPASWQGVRECKQFGFVCPQNSYPTGSIYAQPPQPQSEDCLFLNVWTAAEKADEKRPVMVWIHGGALTRGSGSLGVYDGESLARKGVVLVTINYRLGPFGYFAHPALSSESSHASSGNYGVLDQIAALQWVKRNIAAFGGDPGRVTIFGESAGSWSVCALVATPLSRGLFHRAIGESGGCFSPMQYLKREVHGLPPAEKAGESLAAILGCDKADAPLAALRAKTTEEILAAAAKDPAQARTRANVDGWVFPDEIFNIYFQGKQNLVPVIVGSNADEGTALAGPMVPSNVNSFLAASKRKYDDLSDRFLKVYPVTSESDVRDAFVHSLRDEWFTWEMRTWARLMRKAGGQAYVYYFSRVPPRPDATKYGAYHAAEIIYAFDNLRKVSWMSEPADQKLAEAMSGAWVRFAASGEPDGGNLPDWPAYDQEKEPYLEFGNTIREGQALLKGECDFFDAYYAAKRGGTPAARLLVP